LTKCELFTSTNVMIKQCKYAHSWQAQGPIVKMQHYTGFLHFLLSPVLGLKASQKTHLCTTILGPHLGAHQPGTCGLSPLVPASSGWTVTEQRAADTQAPAAIGGGHAITQATVQATVQLQQHQQHGPRQLCLQQAVTTSITTKLDITRW